MKTNILKSTIVLFLVVFGQAVSAQEKDSIQQKKEVEEQELGFVIVEEMPEYTTGVEDMLVFIKQHLEYPQQAVDSGIEGRVFVQFIVETDGSLTGFEVLRGIGSGCDEAAVEVLKKMPNWKPARQRGKAVRVKYMFPVIFKLENEKTE